MGRNDRSLVEWVKYLSGLEVMGLPMSQADFDSRCLMDIRSNLIQLNQSNEHLEGMSVNREKVDHQMAQLVGIAPMTNEERVEALNKWRAAVRVVQGVDPPALVDLSSLPPKQNALE